MDDYSGYENGYSEAENNEKQGVSSFTYDLLERESQSEEQKERRAVRRKKLEHKAKANDPERIKRARSRRRTLALLVLAVAVAAGFAMRSVGKMISLSQERDRVAQQLADLEKKKSELEVELLQVNSDEYVEQQARSQLHMIKPGEILYIVPAPAAEKTEGDAEGAPEGDPAEEAQPETAKP